MVTGSPSQEPGARVSAALFVFVEVFQLFLEPFFGKHVFELAPGSLAFLRHGLLAAVDTLDKAVIVLAFLRVGHEVFIQVELFRVSFHIATLRKPLFINVLPACMPAQGCELYTDRTASQGVSFAPQ
jgi:hypothetical protein